MSNDGLVDNLLRDGVVKSQEVDQVLRKLDRANYVADRSVAYQDSPQPIGLGVTISAPHMHAFALERLWEYAQNGRRVLDVGVGSGYLAAAFGHLVGEDGKCFGIDCHAQLVDLARENVLKDQGSEFSSRLDFRVGDGWKGLPEEGPFDAIHVGAAAAELPAALLEQLAPGGRLVIPVGPEGGNQELIEVDKDKDGDLTQRSLLGVRYVPLVKSS